MSERRTIVQAVRRPDMKAVWKEGWLTKASDPKATFKNYKKRFFVLDNELLSYYKKDAKTQEKKGSIRVADIEQAAVGNDVQNRGKGRRATAGPSSDTTFFVLTPDRDYEIRAEDYDSCISWVKTINTTCLLSAFKHGSGLERIVNLLKCGASPNALADTDENMAIISIAVRDNTDNSLTCARELLRHGAEASVLLRSRYIGFTVPFAQVLDFFLVNSDILDINMVGDDTFGYGLLHFACDQGDESAVCRLLECQQIVLNTTSKTGDSPLHALLKSSKVNTSSKVSITRFLVQAGADCSVLDQDRNTCIHVALKNGLREVAHILIRGSPATTLDTYDGERNTLLHLCLKLGLEEETNMVIERGANPNLMDSNGDSSLVLAIYKRWNDVVQKIVESGNADINHKAVTDGMSPLSLAVRNCDIPLSRFLIKRHADPNSRNLYGENALYVAVHGIELSIIDDMYKGDSDVRRKSTLRPRFLRPESLHVDYDGYRNKYLSRRDVSAQRKVLIDLLDEFLADVPGVRGGIGGDENGSDGYGTSDSDGSDDVKRRMRNATLAQLDTRTFPMKSMAEITQTPYDEVLGGNSLSTSREESVLHAMARIGLIDEARKLLDAAAKHGFLYTILTSADYSLCTPLHVAVAYNHLDFVEMLLEYVHSPENVFRFRDTKGRRSSRQSAFDCMNRTTVVGCTALHVACRFASVPITGELLKRGCVDHALWDKDGRCAIHIAIEQDYPDLLPLFHQSVPGDALTGALRSLSELGDSPLHLSLRLNRRLCALRLLDYSAAEMAINAPSPQSRLTPLHMATQREDMEIVGKILSCPGVNTRLVDSNGCSAVYVAARTKNLELLELFRDAGVDMYQPNEKGETAQDVYNQFMKDRRSIESAEAEATRRLEEDAIRKQSISQLSGGMRSMTVGDAGANGSAVDSSTRTASTASDHGGDHAEPRNVESGEFQGDAVDTADDESHQAQHEGDDDRAEDDHVEAGFAGDEPDAVAL